MGAAAGGGQLVTTEGGLSTYRYCVLGFTPVATPTDWLIIQGGTRPARIKYIKFTGVATANGNMPVQLIRRKAANSGGTAVLTALVATLHDIGDATHPADTAATITVSTVGTGNFGTLGAVNPTGGGIICVDRLSLAAAGTGLPTEQVRWDFSYHEDKSLYLRGVSDFLNINGAAAAVPTAGVVDVEIEVEEGNF